MASIFLLATIGGLISAVSTSVGALMLLVKAKFESAGVIKLSFDFAIGVMLSAAAFSLIGPELMQSLSKPLQLVSLMLGAIVGLVFILWIQKFIQTTNPNLENKSKILLAFALLFHNLPEGMGAGASLAGLTLAQAIPLQVALTLQNVAEGFLIALILKQLGWSTGKAVLGGVLSGLVELLGALVAGLFLSQTQSLLPFFLGFAGGAMVMSAGQEIIESINNKKSLNFIQLSMGILLIPIMNLFL